MEKLFSQIFSMRSMAAAMLLFLSSIGWATILESQYDIQTAKIVVYNALWFEILLLFLSINLIANILRYRMFRREKAAALAFHLSFLVILLGAGITRYFSFEGIMIITEGESSKTMLLSDPHLSIHINDGVMQYNENEKLFLSEETSNYFSKTIDFPKQKEPIHLEYVNFRKKVVDSLIVNDSIKSSALEIVTNGMQSNYLSAGDFILVGDTPISFDKKNAAPGITIHEQEGKLFVESKLPLRYLPMAEMQKARQSGLAIPDSMYRHVPTDSMVPFHSTTLYIVNEQQFVFRNKIAHAKMLKMPSGKKKVGLDELTVKISAGKQHKVIKLYGGIGASPVYETFQFNGLNYVLAYGSTQREVPYTILCRNFELERYPGSEVASSYSSDVTLSDPERNVKKNQRIFMNNVMDYRGYRFFQSSYNVDDPSTPQNEEGTVLSVNYDFWGTNITYVGYLLMAIGMLLSLFAPAGRFKELLGKLKKSRERREAKLIGLLAVLFFSGFSAFAQESNHVHDEHMNHEHQANEDNHANHANHATQKESKEKKTEDHYFMSTGHEEEISSLLVQDFQGRIVPLHTVCDQLLRKIYRAQSFEGHSAIQTVVSMHMYPKFWLDEPVIYVARALRERLGLKDHASFRELLDEKTEQFKWEKEYNSAHQTLESKRDEFDKQLIKLVERFQIFSSFLTWEYMKFIPHEKAVNNNWYAPTSPELYQMDSLKFLETIRYINAIHIGSTEGKWGDASDKLVELKKYQRRVSSKIVPSESKVKMEIRYNKMNIFKKSEYSYLLLGFLLLVIFYIRIFIAPTIKSERFFKRLSLPFLILLVLVFLYHAAGIWMRWSISGHAPWSNGYEAVVFIAWVTMLAGFIFARKNPVIIACTAILAFFMIFVTEMNLLDPEISPLQPVLKSYWLMIHVAIITGSYGFLGLGAILGLNNLALYIFRNKNNGQRLTSHINEITYVSELTMTIGLFMLTIGTFLGGIWANESWGRYWGWDPKETWALVSVLVYAIVLHLRYIPGLNGKFTFNLVSFWAYGAIIFTFFGVNFYLVGLHSYAQGEGLAEIPNWIYITIGIFAAFSALSAYRFRKYKKLLEI